jgi:single-strand DNA-binding protein
MYQKIIIIGRLGKDPEMRYTQDGAPVTSFSVATDRRWKNAQGGAESKTTWFKVTAWRQLAEVCNQYLKKGALVAVEGELSEPKPHQAKDGTWRAGLDVTASTVKFLSGKEHEGAGEGAEETDIPF